MVSRTLLSALLLLCVVGAAYAGSAQFADKRKEWSDESGRSLLQSEEYSSPPVYGQPPPPAYYLRNSAALKVSGRLIKKNPLDYSMAFNETSCPKNLDWTDEGAVAPPRTQGDCGVAGPFATVAALEAAYYLSTHVKVTLSNQQMIECDSNNPVSCDGSDVEWGLMSLRTQGVAGVGIAEARYYRGYDNMSCAIDMADTVEVASMVKLDDYQVVPADEDSLMLAVCQQPVIAYMQATDAFAHYTGGIFDDVTCDTDGSNATLNHVVLVVGYGTASNGEDYWLIKNSFKGAAQSIGSWGEGGFMRMKRGVNMCGIATLPGMYPIVNAFNAFRISDFEPYYLAEYTVQPGDTVFSLAKKFDIGAGSWLPYYNPELATRAKNNGGLILLTPGEVLTIPSLLYMAITDRDCIRKVTAAGEVYLISGNCSTSGLVNGDKEEARYKQPHGITMDKEGTVYVADTDNHCIRKVYQNGTVVTFAGECGLAGNYDGVGTIALFNGPKGVAVDEDGFVFVADTNNNCIRKISPTGRVIQFAGSCGQPRGRRDGQGSDAEFDGPQDVAVDGAGNVYVADTNNNCIRRIRAYGKVEYLAGWCGEAPKTTGQADGVRKDARFNRPTGLIVDKSGVLYVADSENNCIRQVSGGGTVKTVAGECGPDNIGTNDGSGQIASFHHPTDVTIDLQGNLIVTDTNNRCIRQIDPFFRVATVAGVCGAPQPKAPEEGPNQNLYSPWGIAIYVAPLRPPPPPLPPSPPPPPPSPNPPPPPPSGCPPDYPFRCVNNWNQAICFTKPEYTEGPCGGPWRSWCALADQDPPEQLLALIGTQGSICRFPPGWDRSNVVIPDPTP